MVISSRPICSSISTVEWLVDDGAESEVASEPSCLDRRNMDDRRLLGFDAERSDLAGFMGFEHINPRSRGVKS
jgi:hypothetical protein